MFTLEAIEVANSKIKSGSDFPIFIKELSELGITSIETYVNDGTTLYKDKNGHSIKSKSLYNNLIIAERSNKEMFIHKLKEHQAGKTDFFTFCSDCAHTGIDKWIISINNMTCTYFDKYGNILLEEKIPA